MIPLRDGVHTLARSMASAWRRGREERRWMHLEPEEREARLRDLGLARFDPWLFSERSDSATSQLPRMMAVFGVDPMTPLVVGNGVKRDLERVCSACPARSRCARVLDQGPTPEACAFCPNAMTLEALGHH